MRTAEDLEQAVTEINDKMNEIFDTECFDKTLNE